MCYETISRRVGFALVGLAKSLPIGLILGALCSCANLKQPQDPMLGTWENLEHGDRVTLALKPEGLCAITVERALANPKQHSCKFEPYNDRFLIFLVKEDGLCGSEADFEFIYSPAEPLIDFIVNYHTITMQKVQ